MNGFSHFHLKNLLSQTLYLLKGFIGFGSIIIIHELGHFFACKLFGVSTPFFSIGLGPTIAKLIIGDTTFCIGIIPVGGYVSIDQAEFMLQPYLCQITILCSGIIANLLIALALYRYLGKSMQEYRDAIYNFNPRTLLHSTYTASQNIIGPIGIVRIITESIKHGLASFLPTLGSLNILVALTNILPIPLLDGGRIVRVTVGQFIDISPAADYCVMTTSLIALILLLGVASINDIKGLIRK